MCGGRGGERQKTLEAGDGGATRSRIIDATFHVLMERGYAGASTREIARRARVSKRELYALFDSKDGILAAMIGGRAARMRQPLALPDVADRDASGRDAPAIRRSACCVKGRSPRSWRCSGWRSPRQSERQISRAGSTPTAVSRPAPRSSGFSARAAKRGLLGGDPQAMATRLVALLWGELQLALLLRLAEAPSPDEIERRAASAVTALLALHPPPVIPAR